MEVGKGPQAICVEPALDSSEVRAQLLREISGQIDLKGGATTPEPTSVGKAQSGGGHHIGIIKFA